MAFRLAFLLALAMGLTAFTARADTPGDVQRMIVQEATSRGVPPSLALAVARVESNFNPAAQSPVGAIGVMQLMPKTARDVFGVAADQLWQPRLNIRLGVAYLEQLYEQYGNRWDLALSHYNGGTLQGGSGPYAIPHDYTRQYVADVLRWQRTYAQGSGPDFAGYKPAPQPWRSPSAATRPWRRIDPLEFDDWAQYQQQHLSRRPTREEPADAG